MQRALSISLAMLLRSAAAVPATGYENGWAVSPEAVAVSQPVKVTLVVNEQGAEEVRRIAHAVSDPASPSYGEFLTTADLMALTAPRTEDMAAVTGWLEANGVGYQTRHSNVIASMAVSTAAKMFATTFHVAENAATGQSLVRAADYALPAEVERSVQSVFGLHGLPLPPRQGFVIESRSAFPRPPVNVTPDVIASTYQVGGVKVSRSEKNRQAVAEFQGQFMNSTDLANMFKEYVTGYQAGTDDVVEKFFGKHEENSGGIEAELDIQYIMAPAVGIKTEFWEFPGDDFGADLNQWTSNLTSQPDVPLVHSVSYGWQGNLSQIHVLDADVETIDSNLAKMATLGMSVMISSGDSGSGYTPSPHDSCSAVFEVKKGVGVTGESTVSPAPGPARDEQNECCDRATAQHAKAWSFTKHFWQPRKNTCTIYHTVTGHKIASQTTTTGTLRGASPTGAPVLWASWPASSPWVTAVGATRFQHNGVGNAEMASDQFGSGGGFSKQFDQADAQWQAKATAHYLATVAPSTLPPPSSYDATGRGTPDVSLLGEGYQVVVGGRVTGVGGTSAASPAFASMISLLNEARLNAGKKPMGCLNPFLYACDGCFTDITAGSNKVGRGGEPLAFGWNCSAGWDPATGLGTPIFPKLLAAAMGGSEL